jgi:chemotaxis signal transduction protein
MYSKRTNGNKLITPPDVLEEIAAINHLAVAEVVRLLLVQALPETEWKLGTLNFRGLIASIYDEKRTWPH